jgi:hypothetical protein
MNIPFHQVDRKSLFFSHLWAACALLTLLTLSLSMIRIAELRPSFLSGKLPLAQIEKIDRPVAVPVPAPPEETIQPIITPAEIGTPKSILVPQIDPVPAPSVP